MSSELVKRNILPAVKFTGQQPGEEGVELDKEKKDPRRKGGHDVETDEELDRRGLPINEPPTEGKFSA